MNMKKYRTRPDFAMTALHVVEQAIGEKWDGSPLDDPNAGKDPKAIARGRAGGLKGGRARAMMMGPKMRKRIAKKAAKARWKKA
jgi:hypothetical protein